jgi:uncharacterized membrane protein YhaH (DUF805 family)
MDAASLFFKPQGRISPQTYWAGFGMLSAVSIAVLFVPKAGGLLWLATCFPWAMLNAKRLHDMNHSGWVQLVQHLANLAIVIAAILMLGGAVALSFVQGRGWRTALEAGSTLGAMGGFLITGGLLAFNAMWLIWLGGSPGTPYENRFGKPTNWP